MADGAHLARIVRHPVKSIGYEELPEVSLAAGAPLPMDRVWAVAHAAAGFGGDPDGWVPKLNFVRGVAGPALMAVRAATDAETGRLRLTHPDRPALDIDPDTPADAARLLDWLRPLWPDNRPAPARLVRAPGSALADNPEPWVAVLSLASLRDLSARMGLDLSIHRWRGNLWLEGLAPWSEFDLVGREISVGPARLRIEAAITRCEATGANPETGRRDADTLGALEGAFGHRDFGVFARVVGGGTVRRGDPVIL